MKNISEEINDKLNEIEERENVRILYAVESGSRAWGFASPDSDYDVRFVYIRPRNDYLRLDEPRDVIEWQLDEVLDINGWDLKKALRNLARGNATLFEWSNSSIVYLKTDEWDNVCKVSNEYFSIKAAMYHYYGMAHNTYSKYLQKDMVRYKKYFYALRPLLAAEYIGQYKTSPPVLFSELLKLELPLELRLAINELMEIKKYTMEKEEKPHIDIIKDYIVSEIVKQKNIADNLPNDLNRDLEPLNEVFLQVMDDCWGK